MQVFIFQAEKDLHHFAFTGHRTGANLPADLGPWRPIRAGDKSSYAGISAVEWSDVARNAIAAEGYYTVRVGDAVGLTLKRG
jgi:hypothetical protein